MGFDGYIDYKRMKVYMGSTGSSGWVGYHSSGSLACGNAHAPATQFAGIIETPNVYGSYGVVMTEGVAKMVKGNGSDIAIVTGQKLYGSAGNAVATAQVSTGSAIGVAWEAASTDTGSVYVYFKGNVPKTM